MAALKNQKWELFSKGLFDGLTGDAAYIRAGYTPNRANASRLKSNEIILARVAELHGRVTEKVTERMAITVAGITERLMRIADVAEETALIKTARGKTTGSSSPHLAVAKGALMDVAKLNGLVVDRGQMDLSVEATVDVQVSSDRERAKAMAALVAKARGAGNDEGKG